MTKFRLSVIGSRGHVDHVLRELPRVPSIEIVGVASGGDTSQPILDWCQKHMQAPRVFRNHEQMLDEAHPDAVVVAGPFQNHASMCVDAIERGVAVLTEKPAALDFGDLDRLRKACVAHPDVHVAGMMFSRYQPSFYTAKALIQRGDIGDVRLMEARKSYRLGHRPDYYKHRESYGGTIPWVGSHAIDWVMWLSGHHLRQVYATHSSAHNDNHGSLERSALCHFTLCGGRAASVSIDYFRPAKAPSHGDDRIRIVGTKGTIEATQTELILTADHVGGTTRIPAQCDRSPIQDFVNHVRGEKRSIIDAASTLDLTDACLRARQSADEGRPISFIRGEELLPQRAWTPTLATDDSGSQALAI